MNYCCGRVMINLVHGASSGTKGERLKWLNLISLNGSFFDYVMPRWERTRTCVHVCHMEQSLSPETKISSTIHSIWPFMIKLWGQYVWDLNTTQLFKPLAMLKNEVLNCILFSHSIIWIIFPHLKDKGGKKHSDLYICFVVLK